MSDAPSKAEIESMLVYWRERAANAKRPKHRKHAIERVRELEQQLAKSEEK